MNKQKKSEPKKILVRNTEKPVPKTKLIIEDKCKNDDKKKNELKAVNTKTQQCRSKFQSPELNSALQLTKKIHRLEKMKGPKVPDVAFSEKMTRKMNYPTDQKIYKDLIPLRVPARAHSTLNSREPLPQKDKEPVLSDYATPSETKEYTYTSMIKLDRQSTSAPMNNLRLYKIIQMNHE